MRLGAYEVREVLDGRFRLDGGSMFGVVPKVLWERTHPADECNRIGMVLRCLLVEGRGRKVLVDTGIGDKWNLKQREMYGIDHSRGDLRTWLAQHEVALEDITDVVVSHLHFDHAGGLTRREGDRLSLTFPQARVHTQRRHWEWAQQPTEKDRGSFIADDYRILAEEGILVLHDGPEEILPGLEIRVGDGHTVGHQMVVIHGDGDALVFTADTVPTAAHLKVPWIMAFDLAPLETLAEKKRVLGEVADRNWALVFDHEAAFAACRLRRDDRGAFAITERLALGTLIPP